LVDQYKEVLFHNSLPAESRLVNVLTLLTTLENILRHSDDLCDCKVLTLALEATKLLDDKGKRGIEAFRVTSIDQPRQFR